MTRVRDKEKIWVPDRNRTHDLLNTWGGGGGGGGGKGHFIHWATRECWSVHFSHFITEHKISSIVVNEA